MTVGIEEQKPVLMGRIQVPIPGLAVGAMKLSQYIVFSLILMELSLCAELLWICYVK